MKSARSLIALVLLNAAWLAAASYFIAHHYGYAGVSTRVEYVTNYVPIARAAKVAVVTNLVAN